MVRIHFPPAASHVRTCLVAISFADELEALGRAFERTEAPGYTMPISRATGAMPSAGRPRARGGVGSICAVTALSAPMDRAGRRVATVMIRAGTAHPRASLMLGFSGFPRQSIVPSAARLATPVAKRVRA